jgi:hypothetical protein
MGSVFGQLRKIVCPIIREHCRDLPLCDRTVIHRYPNTRFLYLFNTAATGVTLLFSPNEHIEAYGEKLDIVKYINRQWWQLYSTEPGDRWLYCDRHTIREISRSQAIELFKEHYGMVCI